MFGKPVEISFEQSDLIALKRMLRVPVIDIALAPAQHDPERFGIHR